MRLLNSIMAIALSGLTTLTFAQTTPLKPLNLNYRFDYFQLRLPNQNQSMGLVGIHALAKLNPWFYSGIGAYGSARGRNSGFFALGIDGGISHKIYGPIWGEAGLFLGSGGGHALASEIKDGGFLEAHTGLQYDFGPLRAGLDYSHFKFFNAPINDNQVTLSITVPTTLAYALASKAGESFSKLSNDYAFSRNYIAFTGDYYKPKQGTQNLSNQIMDGHVGLVGVEYGHYFNPNVFAFAAANGAVTGNKNGYAAAMGGFGLSTQLDPSFKLSARLAIGSGGGGDVDMGGGFITQPQIGLEYDINQTYAIELLGGYLWAPGSSYQAWTTGLHIKYYFNEATFGKGHPSFKTYSFQKWRVRAGNQWYLKPQREASADDGNVMNLFSVKIDYYLWKYLYLTGQTAFAYTGNAAGYFSGLVGVGAQTPDVLRTHLYAEVLGGAAGGAGLKIGTGKLFEPLVGIGVDMTPQFGIYASVGKTFSPGNDLCTTTINAGFSWRFATLNGA